MQRTKGEKQTHVRRPAKAVLLTSLACWVFAYLATNVFKEYALGLFIALPFLLGTMSTLLHGRNYSPVHGELFRVSLWTLLFFSAGLLIFAWEGFICLAMAFPIGMFFTWLGHLIGYTILKNKVGDVHVILILLFISVPTFMAFEYAKQEKEDVRSVTTSIEINASPSEVWRNVIAFPELKKPTEFIFKTGIAYPVNATLQGAGKGAVRHCNFSTGSFVEPITEWIEPNLLRFSVQTQPEPMKELSFYDIQPNHLHGYWVSKQGQFKLTELANGNTLLEGTTWYVTKIKPDFYWTLWSDYIVHKIHQRVLEHIKTQAER